MSIEVILFFSAAIMMLFLVVGISIGWTVNDFAYNYFAPNNTFHPHPEMLDEDGFWINEELYSVRFVEHEEEEEEEEDDYH
jgi:hypothetical protein